MSNIPYPSRANWARSALASGHAICSAAMRIVIGVIVTMVMWRLRSIERQSVLNLSDSQLKDGGSRAGKRRERQPSRSGAPS